LVINSIRIFNSKSRIPDLYSFLADVPAFRSYPSAIQPQKSILLQILFEPDDQTDLQKLIFRIFYGIYQRDPLYQQRVVCLYKKDGMKSKPLSANPWLLQNRSQMNYRNRKSQ